MRAKTFEIKEGNEPKDLQMMTPKLVIVFGYFLKFCEANSLPVTVTNIRHKFSVSKSNTHPEGRAVDVSVKDWGEKDVFKAIDYLKSTVGDMGAISAKTQEPRVVYFHDAGLGPHFHIQVSR